MTRANPSDSTPSTRRNATESQIGPLTGVRVIELGQILAGPFCGRLLADFGAEVIKIEEPTRGDPLREWGLTKNGRGLQWPVQARNKKCITLDLRHPRGRDILLELVKRSDVLLENFRPGTLEKWNIGPDVLHEVNPDLVIARVSGFGQTGPYKARVGFASACEAMGGIRYINGYPNQPPPRMGISFGDTVAAMVAFQGILAALYYRETSGKGGQVVDVSIMEACFSLLESTLTEYQQLGVIREPSGTGLKGIAPSNIYKSRDGKWLVIAANAPNLFPRLCKLMGRPELADDPKFATHQARGENQEELDAIVAEWAAQHDAAELDRMLTEAGVVSGPIYNIEDIYHDPHYRARDMIVEMDDPELGTVAVPGIVPKLSKTPGSLNWTGPWELGAFNQEIYGTLLGMSDAEIEQLKQEGII